MSDAEKYQVPLVDPKEFMNFGHLQEVNRAYFHPRGMALAVEFPGEWVDGVFIRDESKPATLQVFDGRDDPEGWCFGDDREPEDLADMEEKAERVRRDMDARRPAREAALGFWIEGQS